MPNKIVLKKSSVASKVPVAGDLDFGELAINYTDGKLYFKKADNSIDAFTTAAASAPVTSVGGNIGDITDSQLLTSIKNVDGTGSGLDADTLDGNHASAFYLASNPNGYTSNTGTVTSVGATSPLVSSGGNTPSISIPAANSTTNGYMSSAYASKLDGIAAGATANTGTVTSVGGTGGYGGLTLSGTVTTSGNLTLGGTPTGTWPISVSGSSTSTTGNAATATALQTARTINGVSFNGTANITITAAANGGTSSAVTVNNSDANSTYRMLWHSGNTIYSTAGIYCNPSTDILYASQLQATSDESVKTNWRNIDSNFVDKLATAKVGIYDRTDIELTQAGVSAQSWQKILPETVLLNKENGLLSVNYGNAALVSAVELAKKVVYLEERLAKLEKLLG